MNHFAVFGTHPRLSLAEFKAVRPDLDAPTLAGRATLFETDRWDGGDLMSILGGTVKLGDILLTVQTASASVEEIAELVLKMREQRSLDFGWSAYGGSRKTQQKLERLALPFKKALKARGIASRWVTGKEGSLTPAAVAKLNLTTHGLDICLFVDGEQTHIGLTTGVQDADAWSLRDYGRPARDEIVGMLPPKLARMMVNLARVPSQGTLFDPFCGGGTVLMEAALATEAARIMGSDIDGTQTANAQRNTAWLIEQNILEQTDADRISIIQSDIRRRSAIESGTIDCVVTEGMLGPPLTGQETKTTLDMNVRAITDLWRAALKTLHPLLAPKGRIVCVWPAFKTSHGMARVDLSQDAETLKSYRIINPLEDWDPTDAPLLYARPEQRVMRRIVILEKID
jgi:tRNA G10  N-methylase Trm11